jgi:hypothetical protein
MLELLYELLVAVLVGFLSGAFIMGYPLISVACLFLIFGVTRLQAKRARQRAIIDVDV